VRRRVQGRDIWRVQVKHLKHRVDWPLIQGGWERAGDARFCFVSVAGFTDEAREKADESDIRLLEASDFIRFLLVGRARERLSRKLKLPALGP